MEMKSQEHTFQIINWPKKWQQKKNVKHLTATINIANFAGYIFQVAN